ncbi:GspH/FimT family pseudopilin [Pseudogulbenkiania ferrooxidans]|uniref:Type II secretion system protein H n=1 Tax=Pseudogulbenkiania ferrooxidans 2002 TaxID=279714 RepID=B9Z6Z2_9NEIS|nr:GspH/FimT family pseudopilin [Pseudogulbenkiania ferrooxidans]EEG07307.1 general secretion pathway protein H [Pseudogulbenkiania ferrooxidans 2002]
MLKRMRQRGFSLIEMLISIVLMAVVLAFAVPSFSTWLMNHQIRNAADTAMASLQLARAEAIRTNTAVQLSFDSTTKKIWQIKRVDTGAVLQQKNFAEDAPKVTITPTPSTVTTVTFNGLGRISDTTPLTQLNFDVTTIAAADSKDMRITLQTGGALKLCDPNVTSSTDPRKC